MLYELTFLIKEEKELENIKDLITSNLGQIKKEESWGEKTLSFPIKKNRTAKFYNYFIEMEKKNVTEIRKKLNFSENLLRFLLLISES